MNGIFKFLYRYLVFFLLVAFVITCCTVLFVSTLTQSIDVVLTDKNLEAAAKLTFLNVLLLTLIFTVVDTVRRKITVERPVKEITTAAEKIVKGDFSVRINEFGADETFKEISECFNRMAEELGGVETLRTDFISNVSHEMKTPLSVIQNYATLLREPELSEEKRLEYAKKISDTTLKTSYMMTNVLKLNRLENQQIYPKSDTFDLGEQLCECLLLYENVWEAAGIEIETEIAQNVTVKTDAELLSYVWSNLFSNAFKFTPPKGKVSVKLTADENTATVEISDTGCGMTPETGAHIFEKFYQGDTSHASCGNGLGLALVKRVIDIIHGEISVESCVGKGSKFTVKLCR